MIIYHDQKQHREERVYFSLPLQSIMKESQGGNSKQRPSIMVCGKEKSCLLVSSQPAFFYTLGSSARDGTTYCELGLSTSITNQENAPYTCLQVNRRETVLQGWLPYPDDTLSVLSLRDKDLVSSLNRAALRPLS